MNQTIVPLALGVALSAAPIVAVIMMLLSERAKSGSAGVLAGWSAGVVVSVSVFALLASALAISDSDAAAVVLNVAQIVLGIILLVLAVIQWMRRPRGIDAVAAVPRWLASVDRFDAGRAAVLGFALVTVNPKNLVLAAAAGVTIASLDSLVQAAASIALFTAIAVSTVAAPVIAYLIAADRLRRPLGALRAWIIRRSAVVVTGVLLAIGVGLILGSLAGL